MWLLEDSAEGAAPHASWSSSALRQLEPGRAARTGAVLVGDRRIEQSDPPRDPSRVVARELRCWSAAGHEARGRRRGLALDPDRSRPGQHIDIAMGNEDVRFGPLYRCIDKQLKVDRGESSCLEGDLALY